MAHPQRRTWSWTFDLPPEELWPLLADTNRFNEAMGLPPYALEELPQPDGTVRRRGKHPPCSRARASLVAASSLPVARPTHNR